MVNGEWQNGVKLLGLRNHEGIRRLNGQVFLEPQNLMPGVCDAMNDEVRDAVVREEAQRHQTATSNSARSRA